MGIAHRGGKKCEKWTQELRIKGTDRSVDLESQIARKPLLPSSCASFIIRLIYLIGKKEVGQK